MDREQENMQFLGLFGVYKESYKIILSWRKIFSQITLTLILPPTFVLLFQIEESHHVFQKILHDLEILSETPGGTVTPEHQTLFELIVSHRPFALSKVLVFVFVLIFFTLSTSSVVYTVASVYTGKEVTFNEVLSIIPKVWKRLMVTSLGNFIAFFVYDAMALVVAWALMAVVRSVRVAIIWVIVILHLAGLVYLSVVWQFASVVTVLEGSYGYEAMMKSRELTKGKMGLSIIVDLTLKFLFLLVGFLFVMVVMNVWKLFSSGSTEKIVCRILSFLSFSHLALLMLVMQTVLYFVCKSYHHEIVY